MKNYTKKTNLILVGVGLVGGVINGLFGAGAGLVLVPMIKFVTKLEDKKVHATTLACVMIMCVLTSIIFITKKQVDYSLLLWCLIGSVVGAIAGTFILQKFKNDVIGLIFSCLLVVAGVLMIVI